MDNESLWGRTVRCLSRTISASHMSTHSSRALCDASALTSSDNFNSPCDMWTTYCPAQTRCLISTCPTNARDHVVSGGFILRFSKCHGSKTVLMVSNSWMWQCGLSAVAGPLTFMISVSTRPCLALTHSSTHIRLHSCQYALSMGSSRRACAITAAYARRGLLL